MGEFPVKTWITGSPRGISKFATGNVVTVGGKFGEWIRGRTESKLVVRRTFDFFAGGKIGQLRVVGLPTWVAACRARGVPPVLDSLRGFFPL